jgi:OHCU decarboxylase
MAAEHVPSTMNRAAFVAAFGGIFEKSPWIAEVAFDRGLGSAQDTTPGLLAAMVAVFREASQVERHRVLLAHPDLAGKLASARRLTEHSTKEQASAGLDALSEQELATFSYLNAKYTETHGFPFIIAVRDYDKSGILRAFERRIDNPTNVEFEEACLQVERIAALRLAEMRVGAPQK